MLALVPRRALKLSSIVATGGVLHFTLLRNINTSRVLRCDTPTHHQSQFSALPPKPKSTTQILMSMVSPSDWVLFGLAALCSVLSSFMQTLQGKSSRVLGLITILR
jgi:uncharacterized membrane-anchored protein